MEGKVNVNSVFCNLGKVPRRQARRQQASKLMRVVQGMRHCHSSFVWGPKKSFHSKESSETFPRIS